MTGAGAKNSHLTGNGKKETFVMTWYRQYNHAGKPGSWQGSGLYQDRSRPGRIDHGHVPEKTVIDNGTMKTMHKFRKTEPDDSKKKI